jgi:methionine sulfoxide reductase heme-binding subunit
MPRIHPVKTLVFLLCLTPLGWAVWRGAHGDLTANPIEYVTHLTGDWTLRFLVATLAVTPLRQALGLPGLIRYRRMLGLFAFFYAVLHVLCYFVIDKFFDLQAIRADILKRRFITVGLVGFLLLLPLAVTSTAGWIRRLGGRRWRALHRLVYGAAAAGVVHYYWMVKSDVRRPLWFGAMVCLLLGARIVRARRRGAPPGGGTQPAATG